MIDNNIKLTVYHDNNSSFSDYTQDAFDYSRDAFSLTLTQNTSYFYVGYKKPINLLYVDFTTPTTNSNTLSMQYWNGSTWTTLSNANDDTKGFTRSGFIEWDRNQLTETSKSVNSTTLFWYRFQTSVTTSAMSINGISFIFADDQDLKTEVPEIADQEHLQGLASHILIHVATRNQIIQDLRNKDYNHRNLTTGIKESLTVWDILDANQLKQAAIFLSLSKIFFNYSDAVGDKYEQKSNSYMVKYERAIELSRLSIDTNNDGLADVFEQAREFKNIRIMR